MFLHSKGNPKQKTTHRMGESICRWSDWQGINLQTYKHPLKLNTKKPTNNPIKKWADHLNRQFFKEDIEVAKKTWKVFNITFLEKCKSKLLWSTTLHLPEWPSPNSLQTINSGEGMEKREHYYTTCGNVN